MSARGYLYAIAAHIGFVLLWQLAVIVADVPSYILPSPLETIAEITDSSYNWWTHTWVTTLEIFGGYAMAVIVGVALAVLFVWVPPLNASLMPLLVTLNMVPKVAMAPLFIIWFSYGIVPNMIIAFTICFFPIVLTTYRGLVEVEPDLINLVKALKANRWQIFIKIQLPGSLPYLFSGMKVAAILAVAGAIVGEFIASEEGLGNFLLIQQNALNTSAMMMALLLITAIGMALYGFVIALEYIFITRKGIQT
ncbi:ABC transporter permease [Sulfitobacter mediterraneus]|jgi:NitT/TauT family transport system permease protein|uniref:ABC transporter permease n=1 Tax=Sulfitobacter TaxID=60136 RepID=UPI00193414DA|nr:MULTISPECIES: ABC transporter permease [Sulfitobacter]MBM1633996.1 ABC transporter permease [Sulfitobacter mediterraneus]MBM1641488.1 ABC transporter permease [Sulfitobacter mediterraneus]MBM1645861.1 ABC transporter permease [Sulfitobacter mediterraneus]MBM1649608.1 ABC transporter permease [Sulfitobacter mediterraneus]MBM1653930.1 ABC transporter permease [Sulfitobacter mediterraneus]